MKLQYLITSSIVAITLSACSATANANKVTPLQQHESVSEKVHKTGLVDSLGLSKDFEHINDLNKESSFHPEIDYFEVLLSYGIDANPKNMLLLLNYYVAANQQARGIEFFEHYLKKYENKMDDLTRSNILSAYAVLRATYADNIILPKRIQWVLATFDMLKEAKTISKNQNPIVHWASGLIYAQVPFFFGTYDEALTELLWLVEHPETEPVPGFYREAYHYLAILYKKDNNTQRAHYFLEKSGYDEYEPKSLFMDWTTSTNADGLTFAPEPWMEEIIKGKVFSMHGFGFSDIHFFITDDRKELVAIDAVTQPIAAQKAYHYLEKHVQPLPPLTTLIITHAHWDHIGGFTGFLKINPKLKIISNAAFGSVLERSIRNPQYKQLRSETYENGWLQNFKPDIEISKEQTIVIGGTKVELKPVIGNETEDAMFIYLPKEELVFVGDVMMPYLGDPWVEEGFIDEQVNAMDTILKYNTKHIIHGHYGLTFMYSTNKQIDAFKNAYQWLMASVRLHIKAGYSVQDIMRLNLIPPGFEKYPEVFIGYLAQRNNAIARIEDKMTGYWHEDKTKQEPKGFFSLTSVEYGRLLGYYLDLSETQMTNALEKMIVNGDLELAFQMAVAAQRRYPNSMLLKEKKEEAADRLRSIAQFFDPMKFSVYTEMIEKEHKPIKSATTSVKQ